MEEFTVENRRRVRIVGMAGVGCLMMGMESFTHLKSNVCL